MERTRAGAGRMVWLDALRGLAICLVMLGHIDTCPRGLRMFASACQIPLFYVITGLIYGMRGRADEPFLHEIVRRAKRLLWPYVTFSAVAIAYNLAHGADAARGALIRTIALEGVTTLWFLPACFFAECVRLIVKKLAHGRRFETLCMLAMGGFCAAASLWLYEHTGCADPLTVAKRYWIVTGAARACFGALYMMLGERMAAYADRVRAMDGRKAWALAAAALALGFALSRLCGMADPHYGWLGNPALYIPASVLLCGALAAVFCRMTRGLSALAFFGRGSLTAMATHYPLPVLRYAGMGAAALGLGGLPALILTYALVLLIEAALILAVDRVLPFMLHLPHGIKQTNKTPRNPSKPPN